MKKLTELKIRNVFPFKSATLDLDYEGITVIKGLNKDAGAGATNAAGKSALIGGLAELIIDDSPSGKSDKVKNQKPDKSKIQVTLESGEHQYQITKSIGNGKSYEILKDGKSINIRKVKYSNERITKLFGLTESQFYTRFYIDGTIPHPLIVGKAAAKQDFIVELFDLGNIDSIRKLLNAELLALGKKSVEYKTLMRSLDELKADILPKAERESVAVSLKELRAKQAELSAELQSVQRVSQLVEFERTNKHVIDKFRKLSSVDSLSSDIKSVARSLYKLEEQKEAYREWKHYKNEMLAYEESYAPLKKMLDRANCTVDEVEEKIKSKYRVEEQLRTIDSKIKILKREVDEKPEKVEKPKHEDDLCLSRCARFKEELNHTKDMENGVCPTCGSKVKMRKRSEIESDLSKWSDRLDVSKRWSSYLEQKTSWNVSRTELQSLGIQRTNLEEKIKRLTKFTKIRELISLVPKKPNKPNSIETESVSDVQIERQRDKLNVLKQAQQIVETIAELDGVTDKQRSKSESSTRYMGRLDSIMSEVSKLTATHIRQQEIVARARTLKAKADELEQACKDEKLLKALVSAYSTSGLKKFMIQRCSKLLEQQLNKYRRIFFSEDYEFELTYESKMSVLVHRKYGKKVKSSDIKKLSGAEKRMFTLLLVVANVTMIPESKRINCLFLDEPDANMGRSDNGFVEQMVKSLPLLQKLIPHIILVTPRSEIEIPNSRTITVVKQNGVAKLVRERVGK